jgi:DNA-binding Xre family transcriptional regulator
VSQPLNGLRELTEQAWARFGESSAAPVMMIEAMMAEVMQRRAEPRQDFVTRLVNATVMDRPISDDEIASFLLGAAITGHETTMNASTNPVYDLATDRELQDRARADRSLVPAIVEESLRPPVQNFFRVTTPMSSCTASRWYELHHREAVSQAVLADRLEITQSAVSKLEHADDVRVSTLRQYLEALGARLELVAVFDDENLRVPVHLGRDTAA